MKTIAEHETVADIIKPGLVLRLEGIAVLIASIVLYARLDVSWWLFVALFFAPDISFIGLALGKRLGSFVYNAFHTYASPAILAIAGFLLDENLLLAIAVIWAAHIGMDRMIGYGLKYAGREFKETHIQQA